MNAIHLEQCHAKWEPEVHDPKLRGTRIGSIENVGKQAQHPVCVEKADGRCPKVGVAHPESWQITIVEKEARSEDNDRGPDDGEADIELAETVKVQSVRPITARFRDIERHNERRKEG